MDCVGVCEFRLCFHAARRVSDDADFFLHNPKESVRSLKKTA